MPGRFKVVSEQLGHSKLAITADWGHLPRSGDYTSVLPAVARAAAEAVTEVIPRSPRDPFPPAPATISPRGGSGAHHQEGVTAAQRG